MNGWICKDPERCDFCVKGRHKFFLDCSLHNVPVTPALTECRDKKVGGKPVVQETDA